MTTTTAAYTTQLTRDQFEDRKVLLLAHARVYGGDASAGAVLPLADALLTEWPTDLHFTQYAPTELTARLRKDMRDQPRVFGIAAFDLDYHAHQEKPTPADFDNLIRALYVIDRTPNVVYRTWGGARIVYVLSETIANPEVFEAHRTALFRVLSREFEDSTSGYQCDRTNDHTRLFRSARVMRPRKTDNVPVSTFDTEVLVFHDRRMNLLKLEAKEKPKRPPATGDQVWEEGKDAYLARLLREAEEGCRDTNLFRAACHILGKYEPASAEALLDAVRARAAEVDFLDVETKIASARRTIGGAK